MIEQWKIEQRYRIKDKLRVCTNCKHVIVGPEGELWCNYTGWHDNNTDKLTEEEIYKYWDETFVEWIGCCDNWENRR